jgi:type III secretion system regulator LcrR
MVLRDAFTVWLTAQRPDAPPRPYQPAGFLGGPVLGWQVEIGRTRFVYRVPEEAQHIFYVVLIERGSGRQGLHSPFADMVRLLQLIQKSSAGIRWIRGHVEPTKKRPADALDRERLIAFYQRYLTAVSTGVENGVEWYGGDLTAFSWAKEKTRVRERRNPPGIT